MNMGDVLIEERYKSLVTIIPVDTIDDVLKFALVPENSDGFLTKLKKMAMRSTAMIADVEVPPVNQTTA
jgi:Lon-like ATP-dependent protease